MSILFISSDVELEKYYVTVLRATKEKSREEGDEGSRQCWMENP
jgi:hypothetical protein